jgi:Ca-activated chloride channel family protein
MIHRFLDMGMTVPAEAVRIEEMINYFNFYYEKPESDAMFHCSSSLLPCPWELSHRLLYLNVNTRITDRGQAPPANLVYLIDVSGSMEVPDKLPLIKTGFRSLITNLRDIDTVSLVIFGTKVGVVLQGVPGSHKGQILSAIEGLRPDGASPGMKGIKLAYEVARQQRIEGGSNKIVLITDGDISDGATAREDLKEMITTESRKGIQLTCLGLGMDSAKNSELPWLAEAGKGYFAAISDVRDVEKVLLNELAGNICTVADSVCITADFDTILVNEYHLIGFDNRVDSSDTTLRMEGGQISSGHSLLALFELVPKKDSIGIENIANIKIRYTLPGKKGGLQMEYNCPNRLFSFEKAAGDKRKAACVALFGMKLKKSAYTSGIAWADIEKMTRKNFSVNNALERDYITLVVKARKIYEHTK